MDENWTNSMCTCDDVDSKQRKWNIVTPTRLHFYTEMQISHFCLSKYLYKFFNGVCVCVCVFVMCMDFDSGYFEILVCLAIWHFTLYSIHHSVILVDQSVFHFAWIFYVGQVVYIYKLWLFNYCTSIVFESVHRI